MLVLSEFFSSDCNQSHIALFFVAFESLYQHVNAIFYAGKSSSSFFAWHM